MLMHSVPSQIDGNETSLVQGSPLESKQLFQP